MLKLVIDVFGSDNPKELIYGVTLALHELSDLSVVMPGDEDYLKAELKKYDYDADRLTIIDAKEVITNDESPTDAMRRKRDSSTVKGMQYLRDNESADGMICCGSTGAALVGGIFITQRMKGIDRPCLAAILPTERGSEVCVLDVGANADCRAEYLAQFALLGKNAIKAVSGIDNPRVALLSNGTEDKKGNELTSSAFKLLSADGRINFVGNTEARSVLSGDYDVVVADGFSGNVLLKAIEGTAITTVRSLTENFKKNISGASLPESFENAAIKSFEAAASMTMKKLDYNSEGGAVLLGCKKIIIKTHGAATARTITNVALLAKKLAHNNFINKVVSELE